MKANTTTHDRSGRDELAAGRRGNGAGHVLFVDTHVHIRTCFPREQVFDSAAASFAAAAQELGRESYTGVLMLTESATENAFKALAECTGTPGQPVTLDGWGSWQGSMCKDGRSILLTRDNPDSPACIVVVAGRQIDTSERLEVSVLGSDTFIPDGLPIEEVLSRASSEDTYQILPWAPGKWSLARGRMLDALLDRQAELGFALGDNGGRPWIWPTPGHIRKARRHGIPVFPGSDPLPFVPELRRMGSCGVTVAGGIDENAPASGLIGLFRTRGRDLETYGRLANPVSFFSNEITMQLTKGKRKRAAAARKS